jgi:PleD family two-component response regulator
VPGQDVHVTVSIGLAQYKPQEDMKAFVQRVDRLMYTGEEMERQHYRKAPDLHYTKSRREKRINK